MKTGTFEFSESDFTRLFPFYVLLDRDMQINSYGDSLAKLTPGLTLGAKFCDFFTIERPQDLECTYTTLLAESDKLIILKTLGPKEIFLRGQFRLSNPGEFLLFVGTPWFNSVNQLKEYSLTLDDFAIHDPQIDLLHAVKAQEIATDDIRQLFETVRKQKDQLKMLSMIAEETINAAILTDKDGKVIWVNQAFEQITGYSPAEVIGKAPGHMLQGKDTDPETVRYLKHQIKNALPFQCEILNYSKSGRPYWVRINGKPLFDKLGNLNQFFALEEDITGDKESAMQMGQTASRLAATLTSLKSGTFLEDETGRIVLTNPQFCTIFNIEEHPDDLIGQISADLLRRIRSHFKSSGQFIKRIREVSQSRIAVQSEILELTDGRFLEWDYTPIFSGDQFRGQLWKFLDITERFQAEQMIRQSEEKYRGILDSMELGVIEVDQSGKIIYSNQSFTEISGYTNAELTGKDPLEILAANVKTVKMVNRNTKVRKKGKSSAYEASIRRKDGKIVDLIISGGPIYGTNGEVVGSIGIHLDITERKKLESDLRKATKKAETSSRARQIFLANMSHEIRTPLNAIIGLSNFMLIQNPPGEFRENLEILRFSANNLLALINDILDLSKIDAGKIQEVRSNFEIRSLTNNLYQTFLAKCDEKGIQLFYDIDKRIPEVLTGDNLRLTQILTNLVNNAVKFTETGYVIIRLKRASSKDQKTYVKFEIEDTGIGIHKNRTRKIFGDFEQADPDVLLKYGGTGLGLSISRQLVELLGGKLHVQSEIGQGSTFYFTLPFDIPKVIEKPGKQSQSATNHIHLEGLSILIVEDNLVNQRVAIAYLTHWKAKVLVANHGGEAIEILRHSPVDVILMDLYMPVMNGFEAIKQIRNQPEWKHIPVIALTASAEYSIMNKAMESGADACLTKPFNPESLMEKIIEVLNIQTKATQPDDKTNRTFKGNEKTVTSTINMSRIAEAALGNQGFVDEMITLLKTEVPRVINDAEQALSAGSYTEFSKHIHKLKNNLLLLGMDHLKPDLHFLEEKSREGKLLAQIGTRFEKVKKSWDAAEHELSDLNASRN